MLLRVAAFGSGAVRPATMTPHRRAAHLVDLFQEVVLEGAGAPGKLRAPEGGLVTSGAAARKW